MSLSVLNVETEFGATASFASFSGPGAVVGIPGVGATKRLSAVKWHTMGRIVGAWVLTLPLTMSVGFGLMWVER